MGPGPAGIAGGSRRDGASAVPAAGSRGRAGMFVLAAAAGLALASGAVTGTPAAHAAAAARTVAAVHANPVFEPCPCADPLCREVCFKGVASGGPASMIHRLTHPGARQATTIDATAAILCPPPSGDGVMSKTGDPGC